VTKYQNHENSNELNSPSWEDDGDSVQHDFPDGDLNSLLAREQSSIMSAETSSTPAQFEFHRDASRSARRLVNATPYPEHEPHVFARDRTAAREDRDEQFEALIELVERNEKLLARRFADGEVSSISLQHLERCQRQDCARLLGTSRVNVVENV